MFWFHIRTTRLFIIFLLIVNLMILLIVGYSTDFNHSLSVVVTQFKNNLNIINCILKLLLDKSYCSSNNFPCTCWWTIVWMNHHCLLHDHDKWPLTLHNQLHKVFSMCTNTFHCQTFKVVRINKKKSNDSAKTKWFEL